MGIVREFVKFLSDPRPVSSLAALEMGRAAAEGVVRIGPDGNMVSPVSGKPCLAMYYKAFYLTGSRTGAMMPRQLKVAEVYHSFTLELEDGSIQAVPKKTDTFSADDHKELSGSGYQGFRATEDILSPGMRVRIWGRAKDQGDGVVLRYEKLEILGAGTESQGTTPGKTSSMPKKQKKKGKAKKR
jgi:hypothetical protein